MGNAQLAKVIQNPENETNVRNLFYSIDVDKSGYLDEEEFKKFAAAFLKISPKFSKLEVDIDRIGAKLFHVADLNNNGRVSYSEFHGLLSNIELLEETIANLNATPDGTVQVKTTSFAANASSASTNSGFFTNNASRDTTSAVSKENVLTLPVYLLTSPPPPSTANSSAHLTGLKSVPSFSLDKTAPLRNFTGQIHSLLLPNEGRQDFAYYLNNSDVPMNSNLSIADYLAGGASDAGCSRTTTATSESGFEVKYVLSVYPISALKKHVAGSQSLEPKHVIAEYHEQMNCKLARGQKTAQKATVVIQEALLYLFLAKEKGGGFEHRLFALDYCKLAEEEENNAVCFKITEDILGKEEVFLYPGKGNTLCYSLRTQCRNTFDRAVIGLPLARLMRRKLYDGVPHLLYSGTKYLEPTQMITEEGIFRKSGNSASIDNYLHRIDQGEELDFSDCDDIHNVTSLIKKWLGFLPLPLLHPYKDYIAAIDANPTMPKEALLTAVLELLKKAPVDVLIVLNYLLKFLKVVSQSSQANFMTPENLAIVVGPNMLRPTRLCDVDIITQQNNCEKVKKICSVLVEFGHNALDGLVEKRTRKNSVKPERPATGPSAAGWSKTPSTFLASNRVDRSTNPRTGSAGFSDRNRVQANMDVNLEGAENAFASSRMPNAAVAQSAPVESSPNKPPLQQPASDSPPVNRYQQQRQLEQQRRKDAREQARVQELTARQEKKVETLSVENRDARVEGETLAGFIREFMEMQQLQTVQLQSKISYFQQAKPDYCQFLLANFVQIQQLQVQQLEKTKEVFATLESERAEKTAKQRAIEEEEIADANFRRIQEEEIERELEEQMERDRAREREERLQRQQEEERERARVLAEEQQQRQADIDEFARELGVIDDEEPESLLSQGDLMFPSNPRKTSSVSSLQDRISLNDPDFDASVLSASEDVPLAAVVAEDELLLGARLQEQDPDQQARPPTNLDQDVDFDSFGDGSGTITSSNSISAEHRTTRPSLTQVQFDGQSHEIDFNLGDTPAPAPTQHQHSHEWPPTAHASQSHSARGEPSQPQDGEYNPIFPRSTSREHGVDKSIHARDPNAHHHDPHVPYDTRVVRRRRSEGPVYRGNIIHNPAPEGGSSEGGASQPLPGEEVSDDAKNLDVGVIPPREPLPKPNAFSNDFQEKGKRLQNMLLMRRQIKETNDAQKEEATKEQPSVVEPGRPVYGQRRTSAAKDSSFRKPLGRQPSADGSDASAISPSDMAPEPAPTGAEPVPMRARPSRLPSFGSSNFLGRGARDAALNSASSGGSSQPGVNFARSSEDSKSGEDHGQSADRSDRSRESKEGRERSSSERDDHFLAPTTATGGFAHPTTTPREAGGKVGWSDDVHHTNESAAPTQQSSLANSQPSRPFMPLPTSLHNSGTGPTHKLSANSQQHGSAGNLGTNRVEKGEKGEKPEEDKKGILGKAVGVGAGLVPFGSKDKKEKEKEKEKEKREKEEKKEKEKKDKEREKEEKERKEREEKEETKDDSLLKKYTSIRQVKK